MKCMKNGNDKLKQTTIKIAIIPKNVQRKEKNPFPAYKVCDDEHIWNGYEEQREKNMLKSK